MILLYIYFITAFVLFVLLHFKFFRDYLDRTDQGMKKKLEDEIRITFNKEARK